MTTLATSAAPPPPDTVIAVHHVARDAYARVAAWERWTNRAHLAAWCTVAFFAGALVRAWWSAVL